MSNKNDHFNPPVEDKPEKITKEQCRHALETFLTDPRYAKRRSTMPDALWYSEHQVLASVVSETFNIVDPMTNVCPVVLINEARQLSREAAQITASVGGGV